MRSDRCSWVVFSLALACSPTNNKETAAAASDSAMRHHDSIAMAPAKTPATPAPIRTGNAKIDEALTAAPAGIAQNASVMDWPDSAGGQLKELRKGTNEWTCFPASPKASTALRDPMCLDKEFAAWGNALMAHKPPHLKNIAIGYMLQGDIGASNTDPYATDSTADNHWVHTGPHTMIATPNTAQLAAMSTDPSNGGPWVMWKGTPYAHIMVPAR